jgi:acetyl esterase/lipase
MVPSRPAGPQRHRYGPDPSQFADLYRPAGPRRPGTVVLIHGGWWGARYGSDHIAAAAADLAGRGWVVWNIEYRRLGLGGGYPATLADAAAAIDHLATLAGLDTTRVVTVGHSAGGHLATWAAGRPKLPPGAPGALPPAAPDAAPAVRVTGVVSLAGALDRLGDGAAVELMGGTPAERPGPYAVADPLALVPVPAVVRCVHARADDRVPFAQSAGYVTAAQAAGQDAQLIEVPGDHFTVADPAAPAWPAVVGAIEEVMGGAASR